MNATPSDRARRRRRLSTERLEARRCLTASLGWDGPGQGSAELNYYVGQAPASIGQVAFESAIETALQAWSDAIDVEFTEIGRPNQINSLDFTFETIDGPGGALAQAYLPDDVNPARIAGDVEFDVAEPWEIGNALGQSAFDLVRVAAHEIGHSLGIDHLDISGAVLAPFVTASHQFTGLTAADVDAALKLYAPAPATVATEPAVSDAETQEGEAEQTPSADTTQTSTTPESTPLDDPEATDVDTENDQGQENDDLQGNADDSSYQGSRARFRQRLGWWAWRLRFDRLAIVLPQHNAVTPGDVNEDGRVSASDVVAIINQLDRDDPTSSLLTDCNGDGETTAQDALLVINELSGEPVETDADDATGLSPSVEDHQHSFESEHDHESAEVDSEEMLDEHEYDDEDDPQGELEHDADEVAGAEQPSSSVIDPIESEAAGTNSAESPSSELPDTELPETEPSVTALADVDLASGDQEVDEDEADELDAIDDVDVEDDAIDDADGQGENRSRLGRVASSLFDILDANADGLLDSEELPPALLDAMRSIDVDEDGRISREEVQNQIPSLHDRQFQRLDEDLDGVIGEDEVSPRRWQRLLEHDADASEGIDREEWDAFLASKTPRGFRRLDDNEDGGITEQEVNPRLWEQLSSLDEDGNQAIDSDEFDSRLGRRAGRFAGFPRPIRRGRLF